MAWFAEELRSHTAPPTHDSNLSNTHLVGDRNTDPAGVPPAIRHSDELSCGAGLLKHHASSTLNQASRVSAVWLAPNGSKSSRSYQQKSHLLGSSPGGFSPSQTPLGRLPWYGTLPCSCATQYHVWQIFMSQL